MSASNILFDPTIFAATVYTATALYQAGFMGGRFETSASPVTTAIDVGTRPPEAIGMRRADAFQTRLNQRPRFTTPNSYHVS